MITREISHHVWREELDSFSTQHEGWIVNVKTETPDGNVTIDAFDLPLLGVSRASPSSDDIAVMVGDQQRPLTHDVHDPVALTLELTTEGADRALLIDGRDGNRTTIEFRSPKRSGDVDGRSVLGRR
jgi:hypothetical protein